MPILDGSEMIGEETLDEYLARIMKEASPSWQGVDQQQCLDEVRGRNAGLEWKKGAPEKAGAYLIVTKKFRWPTYMDEYDPDHPLWGRDKLLWHIGPIPPAPKSDEE